MLELKNIKKVYEIGKPKDKSYQVTHALRGVSLVFRDSEFVSILGPSGCGKTTLLNIVGGLDQYTSGDLIINGTSTKEYKDKDWDNYRNNSVGFVFQSYNLIPHQTVLENVELALTLSGVSRKERKEKAKIALEKVGLGDRINSKPNQLSGGQMQRVAIARALVNNPEIILADEPTGALDTKTSLQVMELLKEVAKERLVIMVTHNPDIAEKYSSRIIKMLDGDMVEDSMPITEEEKQKLKKRIENEQKNARKVLKSDQKVLKNDQNLSRKTDKKFKKRMSFWTALSLSFKNLLTKKARTILVSFAGSIGIIGIALILSLSSGFQTYINRVQENTLSTYPIEISAKNVDFTSVVMAMFMDRSSSDKVDHDLDGVYPKENIAKMINSVGDTLGTNNLEKFYDYIQDHYSELEPYVNAIKYSYNLSLNYFDNNTISSYADIRNINAGDAVMGMIIKYSLYYFENKTGITFEENVDGTYTLYKPAELSGDTMEEKYPFIYDNNYTDLVPIITDIDNNGYKVLDNNKVLFLVFRILDLDTSTISSIGSGGGFSMMFSTDMFSEMIDNLELVKTQYELLGTNSRYLSYDQEHADEALLVLDKNNEMDDYMLFALGLLSGEQMDNIMKGLISGDKDHTPIDYDSILGTTYKVLDESDYYVYDTDEDAVVDFRKYSKTEDFNLTKYTSYYTSAVQNCTNTVKIVGIVRPKSDTNAGSLSAGIVYGKQFTKQMITYRNARVATLAALGDVSVPTIDETIPSTISIYINTFESKAEVKKFIAKYNEQADKNDQITYTDYVDLIMSTISTIINAITYVLIAFVSISLVVSSIMIGIITYISVLERTKEIGVLRSVGASKRDIKRVFTAESLIIGFVAGVMGIVITLVLNIPINIVINHFANISGVAALPWLGGLLLVVISMILTFIAGLVPARIASKKDPVVALRTE